MSESLRLELQVPEVDPAKDFIAHYNSLLGRAFRCSKQVERMVAARMAGGSTLGDLKLVTEWLRSEWLGTKYEKYLVPITILRPVRWDERLDQAREWQAKRQAVRERAPVVCPAPATPPDVVAPDDVRKAAQEILERLRGGK